MRSRHWRSIAVVVLAIVCIGSAIRLVTVASNATAASIPLSDEALHGGGGLAYCYNHRTDPRCVPDPNLLALKRAGRLGWPGCVAPKKGTQIDLVVLPTPCAKPAAAPRGKAGGASATLSMNSTGRWGNCNNCNELDETYVWNVFEPSNGKSWQFNFGQNTPRTDDNGTSYLEQYFADLCGPGAADVTLWYWPKPNNYMDSHTTEPIMQVSTNWDAFDPYDNVFRMRGYMMYLAYDVNAGWNVSGMQQGGSATPEWAMREGLNWEASGGQGKDYFYLFDYPDSSGNAKLLNSVEQDVNNSHVPVVVLLNATYLPNWAPGGSVGHYVTIIGYNNDNSQYAYVDTCGYWTYCNHNSTNTDGQVHTVGQQQLFNAILSYGNVWIW